MSKSNEAFWWFLFAQGGVMAALFVPALIIATGFFLPADDPEAAGRMYEQVAPVAANPLVKLVLFAVITLAFFHCAHRIRHTLQDLGLRALSPLLYVVCYAGALVGAGFAAWILWGISAPAA